MGTFFFFFWVVRYTWVFLFQGHGMAAQRIYFGLLITPFSLIYFKYHHFFCCFISFVSD